MKQGTEQQPRVTRFCVCRCVSIVVSELLRNPSGKKNKKTIRMRPLQIQGCEWCSIGSLSFDRTWEHRLDPAALTVLRKHLHVAKTVNNAWWKCIRWGQIDHKVETPPGHVPVGVCVCHTEVKVSETTADVSRT